MLGAVLAAGRLLAEVAAVLEEADFYRPAHRAIWRAILRLADRGEPTDPVTVLGELDHSRRAGRRRRRPVPAHPRRGRAHRGQRRPLRPAWSPTTARRRRVIDLGIRLAHSDADPAVLAHLAGELADTTTAAHGGRGWEPPIPFGAAGDVPAFPVEVLPGWLGEYVAAVATATQTPPDLAGMLALAVLATVRRRRRRGRTPARLARAAVPVRGRGHGRRDPQEQRLHRPHPPGRRLRTRPGHRRPPGDHRDHHPAPHRRPSRRPRRGRRQQGPGRSARGTPGRGDRPGRRGRQPGRAAGAAVAGR